MRSFNINFDRYSVPPNAQFGKLYIFLKEIFTQGNSFKKYENIDWTIFGSHTALLRCENMVKDLTKEEQSHFIKENTANMSDDRLKHLMPLFYLLAKIQCSSEMLVELRGEQAS